MVEYSIHTPPQKKLEVSLSSLLLSEPGERRDCSQSTLLQIMNTLTIIRIIFLSSDMVVECRSSLNDPILITIMLSEQTRQKLWPTAAALYCFNILLYSIVIITINLAHFDPNITQLFWPNLIWQYDFMTIWFLVCVFKQLVHICIY